MNTHLSTEETPSFGEIETLLAQYAPDEYDPDSQFDAVIMLCGGIRKATEGEHRSTVYDDFRTFTERGYLGYRSTTSDEHDGNGALGGEWRVLAGLALCEAGNTSNVLIASGPSAKQGLDLPPDSHVYAAELEQGILAIQEHRRLATPTLWVEARSPNTAHNLIEANIIASKQRWERVALMSSGVHIPRMMGLQEYIHEKQPELPYPDHVTFLSAEDVVREVYRGKYDEELDAARDTDQAKIRQISEYWGLRKIQQGTYTLDEYIPTPDETSRAA